MKNSVLILIALFLSIAGNAATIEEVIESNLGVRIGKQEKDGLRCRFNVSEMEDSDLSMTITYQKPTRARAVRYPSGAESFTLDLSAGTLTFDKSSAGRPNLIYKFDPVTLKMGSVEEQSLDICRF